MSYPILARLSPVTNVIRHAKVDKQVRTISSLSRFNSVMEPLEPRTMMSSSHAPVLESKAPAKVKTPALVAPTAITACAASPTSVKVSWKESASSATGYKLLRSTNGSSFAQIGLVDQPSASNYIDNSCVSNVNYSYKVQAISTSVTSAASAGVTIKTPLAAPLGLTAAAQSNSSVSLSWTDADAHSTGYKIFRSTDATHYTPYTTLQGGGLTHYTDISVGSGKAYEYEIQAINASNASAITASAQATTPLGTPTGLSVSSSLGAVVLTWKNNDSSATGYTILRSTNGVAFRVLKVLTGGTNSTFTDTTAAASTTYSYRVQATNGVASSVVSNTASVTTPAATPGGATVTITTRNSGELVITASGKDDVVSVTQTGSTLTIVADGQTTTQPLPASGLFIYTRGGKDSVNVDASVSVQTTIETIDAAVDDINTNGSNVSVWDDSTDIYTGTATVHSVNSFAGGVTKTVGASLANPKDAGATLQMNGSLWGAGPVADDINQGEAGDCYFLSSLAAFASVQPSKLEQSAVDMGDGTYVVQFVSKGTDQYVRVSDMISTGGGGSYYYARPGADGDLWVAVMEKAFAYYRTGANTYASISGGWMGEVYSDLGVNSTNFMMSSVNAGSFYSAMSKALKNGKEVTLGTPNSPSDLIGSHAYTLISASMVNGVATYVVRNPWGLQGDPIENGGGYATLTFAQMQSNFLDCCVAV